ncbi:MAG: terminase family protein [Planctomycetota bacterium]
MSERKRYYPAKRAKAKRTKDSYRCKNPEGQAKQLANLRLGPHTRKGMKKKLTANSKTKLCINDIKDLNIIEFATEVLEISFEKRPAQEVILRAQYGLPLDAEQLEIYAQLTDGQVYIPGHEIGEGVYVLGARSGKSFLASIIAIYESTVREPRYRKYLNPGEKAFVIIVATRLLQSQMVIGASCLRMLENSRIAHFIEDAIACEISLTNGLSILSIPCSSTAARGLPICCLILDELAWYRLEGPKQDQEIFRALRPRMSQFRGAKFLAISTPASKQGLLFDLYEEGIDKDKPTPGRLTVHGETLFVNPEVDPDFLESEKRRDPDNYDREFLALFCEQVDSFFPADKLRECFTLSGDVPFDNRYRYHCAVDQSGLSGKDRFAMSIAHREKEEVVIDVSRTWATKSGDRIIAEIKETVKPYGISSISLDRYSGGWCKESFERQGFETTVRDLLPPIYVNLKSLVIAGRVSLPDTKGLREGLLQTVAFYGKSNKLSIGHERTQAGHGDESDSCATAIWLASKSPATGYFASVFES